MSQGVFLIASCDMPARKVEHPKVSWTIRIDPRAKEWVEETAAQLDMKPSHLLRWLMKFGQKAYQDGVRPGMYSDTKASEAARQLEESPKRTIKFARKTDIDDVIDPYSAS